MEEQLVITRPTGIHTQAFLIFTLFIETLSYSEDFFFLRNAVKRCQCFFILHFLSLSVLAVTKVTLATYINNYRSPYYATHETVMILPAKATHHQDYLSLIQCKVNDTPVIGRSTEQGSYQFNLVDIMSDLIIKSRAVTIVMIRHLLTFIVDSNFLKIILSLLL